MKEFIFKKKDEAEIKAMAIFVAELERQGIAYRVEFGTYTFHIIITGY